VGIWPRRDSARAILARGVSMNHVRIPQEVTLQDIRENGASWSPDMYRRVEIPTSKTKFLKDLLDPSRPFDRGGEPGSMWYMQQSTHHLIRTKALQAHSCLLYPKGDSIVPINPRAYEEPELTSGDLLMSKDSNVGECVIVDDALWKKHMFSSGIVRLHPSCDRYYLFAFLKNPLFKTQLLSMLPRGATIQHARTVWLDCLIPFPDQPDDARVMRYVSALMRTIVEKETAMRSKNTAIDALIEKELRTGQKLGSTFVYTSPSIFEIRELSRLDTGMYTESFKQQQFMIDNYRHGAGTFKELGFEVARGQNLQVSQIGKSLYSDSPRAHYYRLVAPTDISEYRTVRNFRYLGNKRSLALLKRGDVVFGAEGFHKGRVIILADEVQRTITNIHGIIFHPTNENTVEGIFLGCCLGYLRSIGMVDAIGVGGAGGSLAIGYFDHVRFPKFPEDKQLEVARLYHNDASPPKIPLTLDNFVEWHRTWNVELGIWELDREMKTLQYELAEVQNRIIEGRKVVVSV
jgi:hypothetical protein